MDNSVSVILIIVGIVLAICFLILIIKDHTKIFELIFSALLSLFFFIASFVPDINIQTKPQTLEPTVSISDTEPSEHNERSSEPISTQKESTESSTEPFTINRNSFSKKLSYNDESYTINFNAPITGTYRFDYIINDVNCNYKVILTDSKNEIVFKSEYNTYENGDSCKLTKGEKYTLTIKQLEGFPIATIKIGVPSEASILKFNY